MVNEQILEKTKYILQSTVLTENRELIKVLIAIKSSPDNSMVDDEIANLTKLDSKTMSEAIRILEKANYINTIMEDVFGRSPHKVCTLTENGKKILDVMGIK